MQESLRERIDTLAGTDAAVRAALRFAALSGRFDPLDALRSADLPEPSGDNEEGLLRRLAVVAELADACDTEIWKPHWIMRATQRHRVLEAAGMDRVELAAWRAEFPSVDTAAIDICQAILGEGRFDRTEIDAVLQSEASDKEELERLLRGLVLAEPLAEAQDRVDAVRACLANAVSKDEADALLAYGVVGREDELDWLDRGVEAQWNGGDRLLYIGGIGGIGKSTLMAEAGRRARAQNALVATWTSTAPASKAAILSGCRSTSPGRSPRRRARPAAAYMPSG